MNASLLGGNLLVGIDFSENCVRALLHAVTLAERIQAGIDLVHIFEWEGRGEAASLEKAVTLQAQATLPRLAQICAGFIADRVPANLHVFIGAPATKLLHAAAQTGASLIVLGALGRSALAERSVGRTAETVCERSPIPVLLIPLLHRSEDLDGGMLFQPARGPIVWNDSH